MARQKTKLENWVDLVILACDTVGTIFKNSTFNAVELIKGKLYVSLYVQYSNTDTDTDATFNEFFSRGDYRGHICYEDRYGNPHTDYYTYTQSDKARALRSLLLTYVQRKYNKNNGKD